MRARDGVWRMRARDGAVENESEVMGGGDSSEMRSVIEERKKNQRPVSVPTSPCKPGIKRRHQLMVLSIFNMVFLITGHSPHL